MEVNVIAQTITVNRWVGVNSCLALGPAEADSTEECTRSAVGGRLLHGGQALGWVEFHARNRNSSKIEIIYRVLGVVVKLVDVKFGAVCW